MLSLSFQKNMNPLMPLPVKQQQISWLALSIREKYYENMAKHNLKILNKKTVDYHEQLRYGCTWHLKKPCLKESGINTVSLRIVG